MDAFIVYDKKGNELGLYNTAEAAARAISENEWLDDWSVVPLVMVTSKAKAAKKLVQEAIDEWY